MNVSCLPAASKNFGCMQQALANSMRRSCAAIGSNEVHFKVGCVVYKVGWRSISGVVSLKSPSLKPGRRLFYAAKHVSTACHGKC
jgi:hypothetical protein